MKINIGHITVNDQLGLAFGIALGVDALSIFLGFINISITFPIKEQEEENDN